VKIIKYTVQLFTIKINYNLLFCIYLLVFKETTSEMQLVQIKNYSHVKTEVAIVTVVINLTISLWQANFQLTLSF
jgi:hypothetical protein